MSRIWKILGALAIPAIGWVAAPIIKAKLEGTPLNGLNGMIDFWKDVVVKPMPVWFGISVAVVVAGAAAVVALKWKEGTSGKTDLGSAVLPTSAIKNDLKSNVEFYLNRESKQERFSALMKNATSVWVATHQATTLRANRVWWDKIERLILLEQGGFATDLLTRVTEETNIDTINNDIASAVRDTGRRLEIKSLDAFFNSMIIGSPHSGDSWVAIEIYIPWCPSRHRSSIVITEKEHSAAVKSITTWFDAMWKQQPKPNQRALRDEKEHRLLRTHLEEARTEAAKLKLEKLTKSLMEQRNGAQL